MRLHLPVGLADLVIIQKVTSEIVFGQHGIEKKSSSDTAECFMPDLLWKYDRGLTGCGMKKMAVH